MEYLFNDCTNFGSDVFFENSENITNAYSMFGGCNNKKIKNIYSNNAEPFTKSPSITAFTTTWNALPDGNGYYNAEYNVYIYNNWTPS